MATAICKTPRCSPLKSGLVLLLLSLCSRESGVLIQGSLCSPLKSGAFFWLLWGTLGSTSLPYAAGEPSLSWLLREGVTFQGSLCSPLKCGGFLWQFCGTFGCTSKGYGERETSLALLERGSHFQKEGVTFQGSLCSPLKSGGFVGHFCVHQ